MPSPPGDAPRPFRVLYRAELARRTGRLVAACVATVVAPVGVVTSTNAPAVSPMLAVSPAVTHGAARPSGHGAQADGDGWIATARRAAATCPGLPAEVLVAIGQLETQLGTRTAPSPAGALGPMQFLPSTWEAYGSDGDGDGIADIMNPRDALHGAARLLCANGGADPQRLRSAIWNYNHSHDYVERVTRLAGLPH